jgi:hypothetical protein
MLHQTCVFAPGRICGSRIAFVHLGCETSTHYFSFSGGPGVVSVKSLLGHVIANLCFYIRWDLWDRYHIPMHPGHKTSTHYFSCLGGTGMDLEEACKDTLRQTCVFPSGGICESRSTYPCVRGVKCQRTISHARVGQYGFHKTCTGTRYAKLVFLHSVGFAGHVVHSGASKA